MKQQPPQPVSAARLEIVTLEVTPFQQNCRVVIDRSSRHCVLVDPGGEGRRIVVEIERRDLVLDAVWLTHSHLDHCGGVAQVLTRWQVPLYAHPGEAQMRAHLEEICAMYGIPPGDMQRCPEPSVKLVGGETLMLSGGDVPGVEFKVLFTPGHSPGHLCFYAPAERILLAGDTLFAGSIGRTDLPGGDAETLLRSIKQQILSLPDETRVLSGHGPETTVGRERRSNPFFEGY